MLRAKLLGRFKWMFT